MSILALDGITLDAELQPRAEIDQAVLENYMQLLVDGTKFPPVTVFRDSSTLWLADGFHRWHAHKALDVGDIEANIYDGPRRDALLYSLSANAKHGLPRNSLDYTRAYEIACRNNLVDPVDDEAVAKLLGCSVNWAEKLTRPLKAKMRSERDAEILRLKAQGLSNRQVAKETGVDEKTVRNRGADFSPRADFPHQTPRPEWAQKLDELETPAAKNWSSALKALRAINEQVSVDTLFDDRFTGFDQVFGPELQQAFAWINQLNRRFESGQATRRRA